jgi:hypothetical protein
LKRDKKLLQQKKNSPSVIKVFKVSTSFTSQFLNIIKIYLALDLFEGLFIRNPNIQMVHKLSFGSKATQD